MRVRKKRRSKQVRKRWHPESDWSQSGGRRLRVLRNWIMLLCGVALVAGIVGGVSILLSGTDRTLIEKTGEETVEDDAKLAHDIDRAEDVARAFLAETDPAKRLQWVRNADEVKTRLEEYSDEARIEVGEIEKVLGHQADGGRSVTGFVVAFPSGNVRLLEVVGSRDGPRVDWDAYARYGTATWEDLGSGKAQQAVVRVFCEPATERPEPFEDQGKWTCFRMSSPDLPQAALGFAQVGALRETMMRSVVLGTPNYRQRFILEITRHAGKDEPLFEITRCIAVGWIRGERDAEEEWGK